jgi:hypothetical protein
MLRCPLSVSEVVILLLHLLLATASFSVLQQSNEKEGDNVAVTFVQVYHDHADTLIQV